MNKKLFSVLVVLAGLFCLNSYGSTKVDVSEPKNFEETYYANTAVVTAYDAVAAAIAENTKEIFSEIKIYAKDNSLVYEYVMAVPLAVSKEDAAVMMEGDVIKMKDTIPVIKEQIKKEVGYDGDIGITYIYKDVNGEPFFSYTFE